MPSRASAETRPARGAAKRRNAYESLVENSSRDLNYAATSPPGVGAGLAASVTVTFAGVLLAASLAASTGFVVATGLATAGFGDAAVATGAVDAGISISSIARLR